MLPGQFNIGYDGPAKRFDDDTASEDLQSTCPELYEDLGMEIRIDNWIH